MKCYIDTTGRLHRTQADAKASGLPFEVEIVPNDQQSLIDYINARSAPAPAPTSIMRPATEEEAQRGLNNTWPGDMIYTSPDQVPPHKNGDKTFVFMGSRHPQAIFMCTHCGRQNHNKAE